MTEATEVENAMYELADNACRALGVDPDKVEDPVGPVTARENVIYAMYKHAENIEATRQSSVPVQGEPVAFRYDCIKAVGNRKHLDPSFHAGHRCNMDPKHWTETPLYTHAPTERERVLLEALHGLRRVLLPVHMTLAEREIADDPVPDDAVLFSFMGSGCSDRSTVGEFNAADKAALAAIAKAQETQ
jgi:hypothetical protein